MNILIVADNFTKGGMETHFATYYENLKNKIGLFYCFSNFEDNIKLKSDNVYTGFHFNFNDSIADLKEDVDKLVNIIYENKIDIIQVNPFYCVFSCFFAAVRTNTKLVYTMHSSSSINFTVNLYDQILFEYTAEKCFSAAISVSELGEIMFDQIGMKNNFFLPNPFDFEKYRKTKISDNKHWAVISRLDSDKEETVRKVIESLDDIDIDELDIYGDGDCIEELKNVSKSCKKNVNFMGYRTDLPDVLFDKYSGVICSERCAIEGLAMGYPVLFVGHSGFCGIIDEDIYDHSKKYNFMPNGVLTKSISEINKQLEMVYSGSVPELRERVFDDFNIEDIGNKYLKIMSELKPAQFPSESMSFVNDILSLNKDVLYHNSRESYEVARRNLMNSSNRIAFRNKFLMMDMIHYNSDILIGKTDLIIAEQKESVIDLFDTRMKQTADDINKKIDDSNESMIRLNDKIDRSDEMMMQYAKTIEEQTEKRIYENVNSKWIIKNDLRKIKNKIKHLFKK